MLAMLVMTEKASRSDEELLSKATSFIEKNISDPDINADALCREFGISKSVLYIKVKNLTGQTVNEFIRVIRLKKSLNLLLEGKLNVAQVSFEVGFNSPSYFTRSFSQYFGISPKKYVLKHRFNR